MVIIECFNLENDEFKIKKVEYSLRSIDKVVLKVIDKRKKYSIYTRVVVRDLYNAVVIEI